MIVIGVDGTGPLGNGEYQKENLNSHVSQVIRASARRHKHVKYLRGPSLAGAETELLAREVFSYIAYFRKFAAQSPPEKICLVGHSRGGAAVIRAAQIIQRVGLPAAAQYDVVGAGIPADGGHRRPDFADGTFLRTL